MIIIIIIIVIVLAVITIISSYVNERYSTTLDIEIEKKKEKCGKYYIYHGLLSQEWIDRRY